MNERVEAEHPVRAADQIRAYLQLFRLPNVFTALADVLLGFLATHLSLQPLGLVALLGGASCLIYLAGMVLNDLYDVEIDRHERPARPLPSGRISARVALWLGFELLLVGVALGWLASYFAGTWSPGVVASLLATMVWLYDARLKQTWAGPLAMGSCRALNVLLGMSTGEAAWHPMLLVVAGGVGLYIVGVTWFARTEASISQRASLAAATATLAMGMILLWWFPGWADEALPPESEPLFALAQPERWAWLWGVLGILIAWRCVWAIFDPVPWRVQMAVKQCILSLIVIDAAACFAFRGTAWSVAILVLLVPTMWLGRWIYST